MSKRPNIIIISFLILGMLLTITAQFGFAKDSKEAATIIGIVGIVLIVIAITLMYIPIKKQ